MCKNFVRKLFVNLDQVKSQDTEGEKEGGACQAIG